MNNVALVINGKPRTFIGPSSWADLTPKQYLQYCRMLDKYGTGMEGLFCLLLLWYKIPTSTFWGLADFQRLALVELLAFLEVRSSRWLLPKLPLGRLGLTSYVGPGDELAYLTFGEFIFAEAALQSYLTSPAPEHAARLTAALYRPYYRNGNGQRLAFEPRLLDRDTERAMKLPSYVLDGVVMNYMGCRDRFSEYYPYLFRPSTDLSEPGGNWVDVGLSLARQTGALGPFDQIGKSELFLTLTTLDQIMKEQHELKKQLEKANG